MFKYWHSLLADIRYTISESFQSKQNLCDLHSRCLISTNRPSRVRSLITIVPRLPSAHRFYNAQRRSVAGPILPISTGNVSKFAVTSLRGSVCDLRASFVLPQSKSIMTAISEIRDPRIAARVLALSAIS